MPFIEYIKQNFHPGSRAIIANANTIIDDWMAQGYKLTLRQIYYRFIALDLLPASWIDAEYNKRHHLAPTTKNTIKNYKKLGEILNAARLGGKVDWDAMEDRTRSLMSVQHWNTPEEAVKWVANQYRKQKWDSQKTRVEVWIEKDALLGIFEDVCNRSTVDVPFFSCRGYNSQSEMWAASQRVLYYERKGIRTVILQFSDHDPSGIDMTNDIKKRLTMFGCHAVVKRLALTIKQVRRFKLPPNPAKETDCRFEKYSKKYGNESWELDALEPSMLAALVTNAVTAVRNKYQWDKDTKTEALEIKKLKAVKFGRQRKKAKR